jgi:hypothetical protein
MFVLRTVMVSPCSEGAVSTNINRQRVPPMLCYPSTKTYGITVQKSIIVRRQTCDATSLFAHSTCRLPKTQSNRTRSCREERMSKGSFLDYCKELSRYLAKAISGRSVTTGVQVQSHAGTRGTCEENKLKCDRVFPKYSSFPLPVSSTKATYSNFIYLPPIPYGFSN